MKFRINKLIEKYLYMLIFFLLAINVVKYFDVVFEMTNFKVLGFYFFDLIRFGFGVIFITVLLSDFKKFSSFNKLLLALIIMVGFLDYYIGIILFIIAIIGHYLEFISGSKQED